MFRLATTLLIASSAAYRVRPLSGTGRSTAAATSVHARGSAAMVAHAPPPTEIAMPGGMSSSEGDSKSKKIFVLGGDGFCGWPTAVHLADKGHEVVIIDNLSRRKIDVELGCASLTPIVSPEMRVATWHELTGKTI